MNQIKEIYEKKLENEWKSDLNVGQYSMGWLYLQRYFIDKDQMILDAGCGNGSYSYSVLEEGAKNVYAIDLFDKAPFEKEGFHYSKASIDKLPFENDFFDIIFAQSVIYYSSDCGKTIDEWKRVLKPGGIIYISGHTKYSIYTLVRKIKLLLQFKSVEHLKGVKFFSTNYYKRLIKENGLKIIKIDGWGVRSVEFIFKCISVLARVLHIQYKDPRKVISNNKIWCQLKSLIGYHFVIIAQKGIETND